MPYSKAYLTFTARGGGGKDAQKADAQGFPRVYRIGQQELAC